MPTLHIRPLDPAARERFAELWHATQERFADDPQQATMEADRLLTEVMRQRGYPVDDFDRRASEVSAENPQLVANYRAAHEIAIQQGRGKATTEDLRQARQHLGSLFDELLVAGAPEPAQARR